MSIHERPASSWAQLTDGCWMLRGAVMWYCGAVMRYPCHPSFTPSPLIRRRAPLTPQPWASVSIHDQAGAHLSTLDKIVKQLWWENYLTDHVCEHLTTVSSPSTARLYWVASRSQIEIKSASSVSVSRPEIKFYLIFRSPRGWFGVSVSIHQRQATTWQPYVSDLKDSKIHDILQNRHASVCVLIRMWLQWRPSFTEVS